MIKTADLQRSKRLKELGWEQDNYFFHYCGYNPKGEGSVDWKVSPKNEKYIHHKSGYSAPTAGEMIEWLIKDNTCKVDINSFDVFVYRGFDGRSEAFEIETTLENALADACAWVLERKE